MQYIQTNEMSLLVKTFGIIVKCLDDLYDDCVPQMTTNN